MEKQVLIHVRGLQMVDEAGEEESIELIVPGEYYFRNGTHFLRYEELMEDIQGPIVNYIKFSSRGMEVRKQGPVNTHMIFQQGKRNATAYQTPYGEFQMGISATELQLDQSEGSIRMKVKYILDMNEEHIADCVLDIHAQRKDPAKFSL